jgi:hypothetical protein
VTLVCAKDDKEKSIEDIFKPELEYLRNYSERVEEEEKHERRERKSLHLSDLKGE